MRAAVNVGARFGKAKRANALVIGTVALLLSAQGSAQARPVTARLPGAVAGGRHDVDLLVLDPNDAPVVGAIVTVQHLGVTYRLASDQWGIARQGGAQPWTPSLSGGAGVGFAGAGETFGVIVQHPTWGAIVQTLRGYPSCDGCAGPTAFTYRLDMGGPVALASPAVKADTAEVSVGCSEGETRVELRLKEVRNEPCKVPHGLPLGCVDYVCGQPVAQASGGLGTSGSTSFKQTLEHEVATEARARLVGYGLKVTANVSSTTEVSSELSSSQTWNWSVGTQPLPAALSGHSGEVCVRTKVVTIVFEEWRATCERIPPAHPATTSPGTRWRWSYFGNTEIPLPAGTCTDLSQLQPDPRCTKNR